MSIGMLLLDVVQRIVVTAHILLVLFLHDKGAIEAMAASIIRLLYHKEDSVVHIQAASTRMVKMRIMCALLFHRVFAPSSERANHR